MKSNKGSRKKGEEGKGGGGVMRAYTLEDAVDEMLREVMLGQLVLHTYSGATWRRCQLIN